jgi:beta-lactamase regulating signal transducer with metallopeptidase domain
MNASGIEALNALTDLWASVMLRASLQGGIAILLVWCVTRAWKRLAPELQCWLWRLAYLKLLIAAVGVAPLALPLLPGPSPIADRGSPIAATTEIAVASQQRKGVHRPLAALARDAEYAEKTRRELLKKGPSLRDSASSASLAKRAVISSAPIDDARSKIDGRVWLLVPWAAGVLACGFALGRSIARGRRLRRSGRPIQDEESQAFYASLARRLGLRRPPALFAVDDLGAPVLIGVRSPVILVPSSLLSGGDTTELALVLSHELGHQKRRDLLWNWLPVAARLLFFVHPLVWLAEREWRLAQELACDALALRATAAPVGCYADLLVTIAARGPAAAFGGSAVGVLDSPQDSRTEVERDEASESTSKLLAARRSADRRARTRRSCAMAGNRARCDRAAERSGSTGSAVERCSTSTPRKDPAAAGAHRAHRQAAVPVALDARRSI